MSLGKEIKFYLFSWWWMSDPRRSTMVWWARVSSLICYVSPPLLLIWVSRAMSSYFSMTQSSIEGILIFLLALKAYKTLESTKRKLLCSFMGKHGRESGYLSEVRIQSWWYLYKYLGVPLTSKNLKSRTSNLSCCLTQILTRQTAKVRPAKKRMGLVCYYPWRLLPYRSGYDHGNSWMEERL